ncbi:Pyocin-S2 [Delftia tsuruhatensis]|uniref:S-type pyocin domain-containing protein n=1 Tax=Delftia tsuruhatensis TaxID=180282 RepID=UPI001E7131A1|nr:S-type pyocin domain-containing protein [Delftia tsuruhatensis]CAB5670586.1 Pyocin-S2 [Delftia tsuruhatensis]CAC9683042.1 Pyocin-S2 [Delftia tsuruhatensis]
MEGYFIRLGDKTSCGGEVLQADSRLMFFGIAHAREGDPVSCGKDGKVYQILGGIPSFDSHDRLLAGHLDSLSGCPCQARLIPSFFTATYESHANAAPAASSRSRATPAAPSAPVAANHWRPSAAVAEQPMGAACVFAKCRKLPDALIDYSTARGTFPIDSVDDYGSLVLLGARELDERGQLPLKQISGAVPPGFGSLAIAGIAADAGASCGGLCEAGAARAAQALSAGVGRLAGGAALSAGMAGATLLGVVAMLWPSSLGDSALYTEEQLRAMHQARTRLRIRVEQRADGSLKGYGFNTQLRSDWETIPVVQFSRIGSQMVADLGDGLELIWTPAVNPADTLGIPALEAAPQAPQIAIYPPVEQADSLIVNPLYPPEYRDFILVFPADSGVAPLYIVVNARHDAGTVTGRGKDVKGIWLAGAGEGLGVPIPVRIADKLRGLEFSRFDDFREAFWKAVANDASLASQFNKSNLADMRRGVAPIAVRTEHAGKRTSFELHHIELIKDGGAVYDIENIRAVTPRRHIDIHRGR